MEDYIDYRGYKIYETPDGYYTVGDIEFYSVDEAMDWVDEEEDYVPPPKPKKLHKYIFFYVDRATDCSFEVVIDAYSYEEAEKKLYRDYDVYSIADWYKIDWD